MQLPTMSRGGSTIFCIDTAVAVLSFLVILSTRDLHAIRAVPTPTHSDQQS